MGESGGVGEKTNQGIQSKSCTYKVQNISPFFCKYNQIFGWVQIQTQPGPHVASMSTKLFLHCSILVGLSKMTCKLNLCFLSQRSYFMASSLQRDQGKDQKVNLNQLL